MYKNKKIGVIIPAYNEEVLIKKTLDTMPEFIDKIIVINDGSRDQTLNILKSYQKKDDRITVIDHKKNMGLGQSLIDGYIMASKEENLFAVAVMAGDAQMSPEDLPWLLEPLINEDVDYVKGNRLFHEEVTNRMPAHRFIGNAFLTLLTKFATGYWHVVDPQCGYTIITIAALKEIPINKMTKGYGYNADILNMLNINNFKVADVEIEPVYGDEKSKIKLWKYIPKVSILLSRLFLRRISTKYAIKDFHPLVLFYLFSFFNLFLLSAPLSIRFLYLFYSYGEAPKTTLIILTFTFIMGFLSLFFAMYMDMEDNRMLSFKKRHHRLI